MLSPRCLRRPPIWSWGRRQEVQGGDSCSHHAAGKHPRPPVSPSAPDLAAPLPPPCQAQLPAEALCPCAPTAALERDPIQALHSAQGLHPAQLDSGIDQQQQCSRLACFPIAWPRAWQGRTLADMLQASWSKAQHTVPAKGRAWSSGCTPMQLTISCRQAEHPGASSNLL